MVSSSPTAPARRRRHGAGAAAERVVEVSSSSPERGVRLRPFALRLLFAGGLTVPGWLAGAAVASASTAGSPAGGSLLGVSTESAPLAAVTVGQAADGSSGVGASLA